MTEANNQELLPCPFCGSDVVCVDVLLDYGPPATFRVTCEECESYGPEHHSAEEAKEAWNTRSTPKGMKLVPVEPTEEMIKEFWGLVPSDSFAMERAKQAYTSMLNAAPGENNED